MGKKHKTSGNDTECQQASREREREDETIYSNNNNDATESKEETRRLTTSDGEDEEEPGMKCTFETQIRRWRGRKSWSGQAEEGIDAGRSGSGTHHR